MPEQPTSERPTSKLFHRDRYQALEMAARKMLECVDSSVATADLPPTHTLKENAERLRRVLDLCPAPVHHEKRKG